MSNNFYKNIAKEISQNNPMQNNLSFNRLTGVSAVSSLEDDYKEIGQRMAEHNPVPKLDEKTKSLVDKIDQNDGDEISFSNLLDFENWGKRYAAANEYAGKQTELSRLDVLWFQKKITSEQMARREELKKELEAYQRVADQYGTLESMFTRGAVNFGHQVWDYVSGGAEKGAKYSTAGLAVSSVLALTGVGTPVSLGTAAASLGYGFAAGSAEYAYEQGAGALFSALMEQKDTDGNAIDEETARMLAAVGGYGSALLETAGTYLGVKTVTPIISRDLAGKVAKALQIEGVQKLLGAKAVQDITKNLGLQAAVQTAKNYAVGVGGEIATEIGQEALTFGVEELGRAIQGGVYDDVHDFDELVKRLKDTAYETFVTVGGVYGVGAGIKGARQYRQNVRKREQNKKALETLARTVQSDAVKNYPYTVQEQMRKSFEQGNDADKRYTYFQAQDIINALFQDDDGLKTARELGLDTESLQEALDTDMPVSIETEKAATLLFVNDKYRHLAETAFFDPADMTHEEQANFEGLGEDTIQRLEQAEQLADDAVNFAVGEVNADELEVLADSMIERLMDTGLTEEQARHHANIWAAHAQIMTPIWGEKPQDFLNRLSITAEQTYDGKTNVQYGLQKRAVYNQPVNDGVNLDAPVRVVTAEPRFSGRNVWELMKNQEVSKLKKELVGVYRNTDTGWDIKLTGYGIEHAVSSVGRRGIGGIEHLEAVANLPMLIENAVLAESHADRKEQGLSAVHRMYAPISIGSDVFTVKLTVKEYDNQMVVEVDDILKLYDVALEKKMPYGTTVPPHTPSETAGSGHSTQGISEITLRTLLEDVKDSEGNRFFQQQREIMLAEEKLREDIQKWETTVDKFLAGELNPRKPVVMLRNTPLVLTLLGADKNLTVSTNYRTLNKVLVEKHKLPADVMKQVPKAMTDPIMIFKSATVADDYVMMLDLKDENGATVVVPVSFNYDGIGGYKVNYVPSVYGKKNEETGTPNNIWFINQIEQGNLVYQNKQKSRQWSASSGLQLPGVGLKDHTNSKNRIAKQRVEVKTKEDLENLKRAYPAYYQSAWHGSKYDFDAFDFSYMGYGEGVQAHGWGAYVAMDRAVSENYRKKLSKKNPVVFELRSNDGKKLEGEFYEWLKNSAYSDGQLFNDISQNKETSAKDFIDRVYEHLTYRYDLDKKWYASYPKALAIIEENPKISISKLLEALGSDGDLIKNCVEWAKKTAKQESRKTTVQDVKLEIQRIFEPVEKELQKKLSFIREIENMDKGNVVIVDISQKDGQLYEVEIPEYDVLLDEDLPFKEQPPKVQKALKKLAADYAEFYKEDPERRNLLLESIELNETGGSFYRLYSRLFAGGAKNASLEMNDYGIKGITYFGFIDGRCAVIFDEKALQIQQKFYQLAYNGSPADFDMFNTDFVGTGEGQAVHGWGLYFSKKKATAARYKTGLGINILLDGKTFYNGAKGKLEFSTGNSRVDDALLAFNGNIKEALADLQEDVDYGLPHAAEALELLKSIKKEKRLETEHTGRLYEVDVPENDVLLDEQKVFSKQHKNVKKLLFDAVNAFSNEEKERFYGKILGEKLEEIKEAPKARKKLQELERLQRAFLLGIKGSFVSSAEVLQSKAILKEQGYTDKQIENFADDVQLGSMEAKKLYPKIEKVRESLAEIEKHDKELVKNALAKAAENPSEALENITGKELYDGITYALTGNENISKKASEFLNRHGIKGISYDGQQDGRCFVVFDDNAVSMLQKYYQEQNQKQEHIKPRGLIRFNPKTQEAAITVFRDRKDLSTVLHETGHYFLNNLHTAYRMENSPAWVKERFESLAKEMGFDPHAELTTEIHERFARMAEAYFREGKAPREELQGAFNAFKGWLVSLYRYVKKLLGKDQLNDEIRSVFDRLLATEEQIAKTKRKAEKQDSIQTLSQIFNMSPEQLALLQDEKDRADKKASAVILLNKIKGLKEAEDTARADVSELIANNGFYKAVKKLQKQKIRFESLLGFLEEETALKLREKWQGVFSDNENGLNLDEAAEYYNTSAENFISLLLNELPAREYAEQYVQKAKEGFEAQFNADIEYMALNNDVLNLEVELLGGQKIDMKALDKVLSERAERKSGDMLQRDYVKLVKSLERKNARLQEKLAGKDNELQEVKDKSKEKTAELRSRQKAEILKLKEEMRLLCANLKAHYELKTEWEKTVRFVRKEIKSKSVPEDYKAQILQFVQKIHGLGTADMTARMDTQSWQEFKKAKEAGNSDLGFSMILPPVPEWLENLTNPIRLSDLSTADLKDLREAIKFLAYIGRNENKIADGLERKAVQEVVSECTETMGKISQKRALTEKEEASLIGGWRQLVSTALSSMSLLRYTFMKADGYTLEGKGPNSKYIVQKIQEAQNEELFLQDKFSKAFSAIWQPIAAGRDFTKEFVIEGINLPQKVRARWGGKFSKDRVIAVALNMGNQGNLDALMAGYGWTMEDLQAIVSTLSEDEILAVQRTWDMLEELRPYLEKTYKQINGVSMKLVDAQPVVFSSAEGKQIELKGGYYPLQFDPDLAPYENKQSEIDNILNANAYLPTKPTVRKGMTISRTGSKKAPYLSFNRVISRHLQDSIKYATHAKRVADVYKIVANPVYRDSFVSAFGYEEYKQIVPWLKAVATIDRAPVDIAEKFAGYLTSRGSLYAMGLSLRTAFMQFTSIGSSIKTVGLGGFMNGAWLFISRRGKVYNEVIEKSAFMKNRAKTFDKTVSDTLAKFNPNATALRVGNKIITRQQFSNACFALTAMADSAVAFPTWIGKYEAEIRKGTSEADAVRLADEAVNLAQGSGMTMDTVSLMRKKGAMTFILMFMSFAMNWQNRQRYYLGGFKEHLKGNQSEIGSKEFFSHIALEWIMPVVLTVAMKSLQEDEYDMEKAKEDLIGEAVSYWIMGIPVLRDCYSMLTFGKDFGATSAGTGFQQVIRGAKGVYRELQGKNKEEQSYNTMKNIINGVGFFTGVPTNSFFRSYEGTMEWLEGDAGIGAIVLGKPYRQ